VRPSGAQPQGCWRERNKPSARKGRGKRNCAPHDVRPSGAQPKGCLRERNNLSVVEYPV